MLLLLLFVFVFQRGSLKPEANLESTEVESDLELLIFLPLSSKC